MRNAQALDTLCYILLSRSSDGIISLPDETTLSSLIDAAIATLHEDPVTLLLTGSFSVVGDLHGDIRTLLRIFATNGYPPQSPYLFLGDYVDRGHYSLEVMTLLCCLKILYPDSIYLLRGNHETRAITKSFGFCKECTKKMSKHIYNKFCRLFDELPLVAIINQKVFCSHGGISQEAMDISNVFLLPKPEKDHKSSPIITDLLWSDPSESTKGFKPSRRGCGHYFGQDACDRFLQTNGLSIVIRGHELCEDGFKKSFAKSSCWTVFSSADYCGQWNKASVLHVENDTVVNALILEPMTDSEHKNFEIVPPNWLFEFIQPAQCQLVSQDYLASDLLNDALLMPELNPIF